jgi:hypothetical protein
MESPIAAIESGRGGVCASATTAAAEPKPAAETEGGGNDGRQRMTDLAVTD